MSIYEEHQEMMENLQKEKDNKTPSSTMVHRALIKKRSLWSPSKANMEDLLASFLLLQDRMEYILGEKRKIVGAYEHVKLPSDDFFFRYDRVYDSLYYTDDVPEPPYHLDIDALWDQDGMEKKWNKEKEDHIERLRAIQRGYETKAKEQAEQHEYLEYLRLKEKYEWKPPV